MSSNLSEVSITAKLAITGAVGLLLSAGLCGIGSMIKSPEEFGSPLNLWGFLGFLLSFIILLGAGVSALIAFIGGHTDARNLSILSPPLDKEGDE
jgi:hypothetical protein